MTGKRKDSYGARLLASLQEAVEIEHGTARPANTTRYRLTARNATAAPAPTFAARDVREIRDQLNVSQPVFAQLLNVSPETVRAWEQGKKQPSGPAERLLEIAQQHPDWVLPSVVARSSSP